METKKLALNLAFIGFSALQITACGEGLKSMDGSESSIQSNLQFKNILTVHVQNKDTRQPLANVPIVISDLLMNQKSSGKTDSSGDYKISIPDGEYLLKAAVGSYQDSQTISIRGDEVVTLALGATTGTSDSSDSGDQASQGTEPSPNFLPLPGGMAWGVNAHLPADRVDEDVPALDRAVEMHMSYARLDIPWQIVEPKPRDDLLNTGDWGIIDASIAQVVKRGIRPLLILESPPGWATVNGQIAGTLNSLGQSHFREYVRAVTLRYKNVARHFEIANEPNLSEFWQGTANQYVDQLLIPSIEVIKSIDPDIKIVGPALASLLKSTIKVEDFYQTLGARQQTYIGQTGRKFFDIISHHSYQDEPDGIIEDLTKGRSSCFLLCVKQRDAILDIMNKNGFSYEPIWIDEFGWVTSNSTEEDVRGRYVVETFQKLARVPRVQAAFVYQLKDGQQNPTGDSGLLYFNSDVKKVYYYLKDSPPQ
jgi:hypothetical protein